MAQLQLCSLLHKISKSTAGNKWTYFAAAQLFQLNKELDFLCIHKFYKLQSDLCKYKILDIDNEESNLEKIFKFKPNMLTIII